MAQSQQRHEDPHRGSAMIAAAIVGAALILSWGMSGSQQRYQVAGGGGHGGAARHR